MAFKVRFSGQDHPNDYGDDDGFEFLEGGVLAIHFGDEATWTEFHPPAKWEQVIADPEHLAGLNTPYVEEVDDDEFEEDEPGEEDDEFEADGYGDEDWEYEDDDA